MKAADAESRDYAGKRTPEPSHHLGQRDHARPHQRRERQVSDPEAAARRSGGLVRVSTRVFLINPLNPKLSIFFLAFVPQFTPADAVNPLRVMAGQSAVFMLMTFSCAWWSSSAAPGM